MDKFDTIKAKIAKNNLLEEGELETLGFADTDSLVYFMDQVASKSVESLTKSYTFQPLDNGYQTQTTHSPELDFVVKQLLAYGDRSQEASMSDFQTAKKCGGGLVTPFIFIDSVCSSGLAASKVTPVNSSHIKEKGTDLVDELLNLYEKNMEQGFFDCDLIIGNYGFKDDELVNLDFGWSKDLWDESTYTPDQNLHWDAFHMGIHKFRETAKVLESASSGVGHYFLNQVAKRYGIVFDQNTISCPRSSPNFIPLAEKMRETVKEMRGNNQKPVYPLLGEKVNQEIYSALEQRM